MPTCSADQLRGLMAGLFESVGTPANTSAFLANSLVAANLTGHDSHGVIRILQYIEVVENGSLDPAGKSPQKLISAQAPFCVHVVTSRRPLQRPR